MAKSQVPADLGQPIPYDPDFNGPLKNRSCTDIICLLLFLIFIGCWAGIAIYAFTSGDPYTLLVPRDSAGSRCGLDHNVKDKPYLFFFDLTKCFGPTVPFTGCPTTQVCVKECPSEYFYFPNQEEEFRKLICSYDVTPTDKIEAKDAVEKKKCAEWYLKSQLFEKRCIPILNDEVVNNITSTVNDMNPEKLLSSVKNIKALSQVEQVGLGVWTCVFK
jgi:choline transporter-like protein 2/4/5